MSFERWLDQQNICERTRRNYREAFERVRPDLHPDLVKRFRECDSLYSFGTVQFDKRIMKAYYRANGDGSKVEWIKVRQPDIKKNIMDSIVLDDEVARIIEACDHPRDKAMIGVAWETGVRRSELLDMRIRDGTRESYGYEFLVRGKTGVRQAWPIRSAPLLDVWLSVHPSRQDKNSFVWMKLMGEEGKLHKTRADTILHRACRRAGLKRRLHWHMFRHTAATRDAKNGFTEAQLRIKYGWSQRSQMPCHYVHLFGSDVKNKVLAVEGIVEVRQRIESGFLKPKLCFGCGDTSPSDARHCLKCGLPLDQQEAEKLIDEDRKRKELYELLSAPGMMQFLERKIREELERRNHSV